MSVSLVDEEDPSRRRPRLLGITAASENYNTMELILSEMNAEIDELQAD